MGEGEREEGDNGKRWEGKGRANGQPYDCIGFAHLTYYLCCHSWSPFTSLYSSL